MTPTSTTYEDILHCARALIIEGGYNAFSYADIAKVVGIRKASIHHHFPAKAELVRVLLLRYREEAVLGLAELERQTADPREQLRAYLGYWEACIADASAPFCVCALLAGQLPGLPEDVATEVRTHFRTLAAWLETVLERGTRANQLTLTGPADTEAELLVAVVHGAMLSARALGDAGVFKRITRAALERITA